MENEPENKNKIVQTYAEDMAHVLETGSGGLIKKVIHGEAEHEEEKNNLSPQSKKNKIFLFLGLCMLFVSVGLLFYFFSKREVPSVPVEKQFTPLIFTDRNSLIEVGGVKKDDIASRVFDVVKNTQVRTGEVEGIYPTIDNTPIGLRKFFSAIEGNLFATENTFVEDNFLMGVVKTENDEKVTEDDFFILIKMRSVPDVFDFVRAWENKMFFDLHGFFGVDFTADTKYLLTKNFDNGIIQNKNARILYDNENKIVLMYIFADDGSILITNTENAAREIMRRLASSQVKK